MGSTNDFACWIKRNLIAVVVIAFGAGGTVTGLGYVGIVAAANAQAIKTTDARVSELERTLGEIRFQQRLLLCTGGVERFCDEGPR